MKIFLRGSATHNICKGIKLPYKLFPKTDLCEKAPPKYNLLSHFPCPRYPSLPLHRKTVVLSQIPKHTTVYCSETEKPWGVKNKSTSPHVFCHYWHTLLKRGVSPQVRKHPLLLPNNLPTSFLEEG